MDKEEYIIGWWDRGANIANKNILAGKKKIIHFTTKPLVCLSGQDSELKMSAKKQ